jgi:hypothetical protein
MVLCVLLSATLVLSVSAPARAQLISTSEALELERSGEARAKVDAYLAREDVAAELAALGVDAEVAALRAAALTPVELEQLAHRIDDAPAGAGVIGVLGVTFLVLMILEWVGVIDIFKKP